ncbi:hypothetical protein FEM48_Zijuj04G0200200 [Ziziphus jujuba var. spinosa]|uniref:Patellin-3-like n=1 Tax=Ziziphus jujuba var. spinosa TaxID=714518 RepID=A0A978VLW9_ZIZJJ|nr:hypothetical protein FEM48_Zijuj04G0200200 [Ziziphus jujuba var. spinosa]
MVEEVQKSTQEAVVAQVEEVVVVADQQAEKDGNVNNAEKEKDPAVVETTKEEAMELVKPVEDSAAAAAAAPAPAETDEIPKPPPETNEEEEKIPESTSFEEESNRVADLPDPQKKALDELKLLVQEALNNHEFTAPSSSSSPPKVHTKPEAVKEEEEEVEEDQKKEPAVEEEKPTEEAAPAPAPEDKPEKPAVAEPEPEPAEKEREKTVAQPAAAEVIEEKDVAAADNNSADDDGAKTVEAIEETIVAVSSTSSQLPPQQSSSPTKQLPEAEEETKSAPAPETESKEAKDQPLAAQSPEEVSIWGIPLLADERSDVILLKFLRARDFKVKDAFAMIKNTVRWRKQFGIDELVEEELENDGLEKVVFMHGVDKEGHPVCYNVYGEFQNKGLYQKTFSDEEKRERFLRWRIRFLEKSIRKLDFNPGGVCTIVQVNDLKNSPGPGKWELRQATKQALHLLQDNYPEFVFINVPWWYLAVNRMISPFLTQRTKSKFLFAGPSKSAETLLRYIAAEQIPVKYGGLSIDGEFGTSDAVTEVTVRPASKHTVEFPVTEKCILNWEVRVVGWEVNYGAEFVPSAEESYTVIIQKARKVASNAEPVVSNSFKVGESGKVVLTIQNPTSKKKKLLYRLKTKDSGDIPKQKC